MQHAFRTNASKDFCLLFVVVEIVKFYLLCIKIWEGGGGRHRRGLQLQILIYSISRGSLPLLESDDSTKKP